MSISEKITLIACIVTLVVLLIRFYWDYRKGIVDSTKTQDSLLETIKTDVLKLGVKLDQICNTTNETRTDVKVLNRDLSAMDKRVGILENKVSTLDKQMEELRKE